MIWSPNSQHRIQGRHRLLKNHRNVVPADIGHLLLGQAQQITSVELNFALHNLAARLGNQPHDGQGSHALATTRFTHDADNLTRIDINVNPVDGANLVVLADEVRLQVAYRQ